MRSKEVISIGYRKDIKIDKDALDYEWERQAELYLKYSQDYANLSYQRDKAKEHLEVVRAEVLLDIRSNYEDYGYDTRPTEKIMMGIVEQDDDVLEARQNYTDAVYDSNMLLSAKNAFEHKKTALEILSKLYLSGYWSTPKISNAARDAEEQRGHEQLQRKLNDNPRMNKRRNK